MLPTLWEQFAHPTSVPDFTNALQGERLKIPINTHLNIVESLPRRAEAVITAKGGPNSCKTLTIKNGMSLKFMCM